MIVGQDSELEIPNEIRVVAERSLQIAKLALNHYMVVSEIAAYPVDEHFDSGEAGADDVGRKVIAFGLLNTISTFEFAQKIVQARYAAEFSNLLTEFLRSQLRPHGEAPTGRSDICTNRFLLRTDA